MGQSLVVISSGSQWFSGQSLGQNPKPGRRGDGESQMVGLWTNEMARKPPPSGGGGGLFCAAEARVALQLCLGMCGAHSKNGKNTMKGEL